MISQDADFVILYICIILQDRYRKMQIVINQQNTLFRVGQNDPP